MLIMFTTSSINSHVRRGHTIVHGLLVVFAVIEVRLVSIGSPVCPHHNGPTSWHWRRGSLPDITRATTSRRSPSATPPASSSLPPPGPPSSLFSSDFSSSTPHPRVACSPASLLIPSFSL